MRIKHRLNVIDGHKDGEPTRMIVSGYPKVPGAALAERMVYLRDHLDWVPRVAINEPPGPRDMIGCILMEPINPDAQADHSPCRTGTCAHGRDGRERTFTGWEAFQAPKFPRNSL